TTSLLIYYNMLHLIKIIQCTPRTTTLTKTFITQMGSSYKVPKSTLCTPHPSKDAADMLNSEEYNLHKNDGVSVDTFVQEEQQIETQLHNSSNKVDAENSEDEVVVRGSRPMLRSLLHSSESGLVYFYTITHL